VCRPDAPPPESTEASVLSTQQHVPSKTSIPSIQHEKELPQHAPADLQTRITEKDQSGNPGKTIVRLGADPSVLTTFGSVGKTPDQKTGVPAGMKTRALPDKDIPKEKDPENKADEKTAESATQRSNEKVSNDPDRTDLTPQTEMPLETFVQSDVIPVAVHSPDTVAADVSAPVATTTLTQKQDTAAAVTVPIKDSALSAIPPSHALFLEAGATYLFGWKTNGKTEANGFNPLIGLQYNYVLNPRIGLFVGLQYTTINNLGSTSHTSTTTHIKFGEEVDVTVISALKMHYLLMPLKLSYGLDQNNFIGIGYTMAYLLDVESKVEQYSTRLNYASTPEVSRSMGYTSGFNPYDGQITVSYRRRLYKRWYATGEFFYGLRDIKNNIVYGSNEFERTCGFKLSLGINLWKK
jgi:hypothetical protein